MDLSKIEIGSKVRVRYKDGDSIFRIVSDFTSSWDNNDKGDYITIVPSSGNLKGLNVQANEHEIEYVLEDK